MSLEIHNERSLLAENEELRSRLDDAEETLRAIRAGEVDALVVQSIAGPQLFLLQSSDAESNRFRSDILGKVSDVVVAVDNEQHLIYLNDAAERQYGVISSEVLGHTLSEVYEYRWIHPGDESKAALELEESGHWLGKNIHIKRNGEIIQVESSVSRLLGKDGASFGLLAVIRDITSQSAAEEVLRHNEALFSTLIDQAPGGVYVVDDQFRIAQVNALARPTFFAAEPLIGRDFGEIMCILWGAELGGEIAEIFRHTLITGERYISPRFTNLRQDMDEEKSYDWETQRITLPNGRHGVVCYFSDVTEQRALEDALRASEQRANNIIQSITDGFITMDREWGITYLSGRGAEILQPLHKTTSSVLGKVFWDEFPHSVGTSIEENCRWAMGSLVPVQFEAFYPPLNSWFDLRVYPSASGLSLFFLDTTERKRAEEGLRSSQQVLAEQAEALRTADRSKDEFLAMLAHELRNPLSPLRNASEILRSPDGGIEEREQAQRIIGRQIENMSRMIDDLLDVSRITEGKIELRKQPVALEAILTAAASAARSGCAAHHQKLEVSMPAEPIYLHADATRLEQTFGNLLGNAIKYGGDGCHIQLIAEVSKNVTPPQVTVTVRDDGAGIEPKLLPRIFDLFVQASRTLDRAHGGLGIGLTLVQRLVKLHGGQVEAHSAGLGRGSEFKVILPILREAPAPLDLPLLSETAVSEKPRRILIVDDNTDSARSLATLQQRRGHHTRTAFTGPDAVAAAADFLPEVVLLDIGLPGMDGFEVARQIRSISPLAGAFLIAMSGYGRDEDFAEAKAAGFDEYLVKPLDLNCLREWLRTRV